MNNPIYIKFFGNLLISTIISYSIGILFLKSYAIFIMFFAYFVGLFLIFEVFLKNEK